jgi:hypothetical protein
VLHCKQGQLGQHSCWMPLMCIAAATLLHTACGSLLGSSGGVG